MVEVKLRIWDLLKLHGIYETIELEFPLASGNYVTNDVMPATEDLAYVPLKADFYNINTRGWHVRFIHPEIRFLRVRITDNILTNGFTFRKPIVVTRDAYLRIVTENDSDYAGTLRMCMYALQGSRTVMENIVNKLREKSEYFALGIKL